MGVRTSLVNTARGLAKSMGERLPQCDADQRGVLQAVSLPPKLRRVLEPLLKEVESLTEKIQDSDVKSSRSPGRIIRKRHSCSKSPESGRGSL